MGALTMSKEERDAFLAEVRVGVLAVERPGGPPLATPVWYRYQPDGPIEISTEGSSIKGQLLSAAGRASLCVQREAVPYAYVTIEGPVAMIPATLDIRTDIAVRYLGDAAGRAYIESTPDGDDTVVQLHPERWLTSDFAKLDAPN